MKSHIMRGFIYLFTFISFLLGVPVGCQSANHRVIMNPDFDNARKLKKENDYNLFPPKYSPLEETELDKIDFREPNEKGVRSYKLIHDPKGDIDRALGYDSAKYAVTPNLAMVNSPLHDIQITWINHASFLLQLGGKYQILTDPVLGPIDGLTGSLMKGFDTFKLYAEPTLKIKDLPFGNGSGGNQDKKLNFVAISHDHYDHLNWNTINQLPVDTHFYIPLGLDKEFPSRFSNVTAMDWYTQDKIDDLKIYFIPANHRSGRGLITIGQPSLWGGWLIEYNNTRIYFSGDTGYSDLFKDIRKRYGKIDICLMPITAWFQRNWHFAPEDAIQAAQDCGCKTLIPWGWGTWIMSYEHMLTPTRRLQYAWDQMQPEDMGLRILKTGETYSYGITKIKPKRNY